MPEVFDVLQPRYMARRSHDVSVISIMDLLWLNSAKVATLH